MRVSRTLISLSISKKLLILFLMIFLPAFGFILASNIAQRGRAIKEAEDRVQVLVMSLAAQQEQVTAATRQMLSTLGQLPEVKNLEKDACNELFSELRQKHPHYCFIGATTPDGKVFASSPFDNGRDLSDSKYFRDAVGTLEFSAGEYIIGRISKVPSIHFSYPVLGRDKKLVAVLIAGFRLDEYAGFLTGANLPDQSVIMISDYKGIRLFRLPEVGEIGPGKPVPADAFKLMSGPEENGTIARIGEDGVPRIYAFKRLRLRESSPPYLYCAIGSPESHIYQGANSEMLRALVGLGMLALLAITLTWRSADHLLIKPINLLVEATRKLGKGAMGTRTGLPHSSDELGRLAESFDDMASDLENRDIERVRAEAALQKAYDGLEAKVAIRTAELARANESLLISEVRYRTLFETAVDPIFLCRENEFIDCNESALRTFGFSRDEILGKTPYFISPPVQPDGTDSRGGTMKKVADALSGTPQSFEWTLCRRDGTLFEAEISLNRFEAGDEVLVLGIVRDITSRKHAERALQESASFQQQLIDALPVPVFYKDSQGRYLGCNRAYETFLGIGKEAIIGRSVFDIAHKEHIDAYEANGSALLTDPGIRIYESSVTAADGSLHNVIFHKATFARSDGSLGGLIGAVLDITELKKAEEDLKESGQLLRSIVHSYPIPTFVIGRDHKVIYWNRSLEEMSQIQAADVVGTDAHWRAFYGTARPCLADLLVDEATPEAITAWYGGEYRKSGLLEGAIEITMFFPEMGDGGWWLRCTAAPIKDSQGNIVGAIETLEDVTARKKAEDALISVNRQLNDIIEFLPDGTFVLDMNKKVIAWNRAIEEMTGVSKKEMIGQGDYAYTVPFYGARLPSLIDLIDTRDEELESKYVHFSRKGDILYGQTYVPCVYGGQGAYVFVTVSPLFDALGNRVGAIASIRDITEQKLAEEELKRSEERLKILFESAPDSHYLIDLNGKIVDGNRAFEQLTGYAKKDLVGKILSELDLVPCEQVAEAVNALSQNITGFLTGSDQYTFNRKDGKTFFIENRFHSIVIEGQTLILGIARDITKRKQAESALKESQQQFANIIDFLPDATLVINREGKVIAWNRAIEEMMGIKAADMLGKGDYEYALPFYGERRPILIDLVLDPGTEVEKEYQLLERKGGVLVGVAYIRSLKGQPAYLYGTASALYDSGGNVVGAIESIRDITRQKLMEEAVAKAEKKYRDIFENSVTGIYQTTLDGRILSINMSIARMLGYDSPQEAMEAISHLDMLYVHPERRSEMIRIIQQDGSAREFEVEFCRKDRSTVWVALSIRAVYNEAGEPSYLEGTASDITDRKLLSAKLEQAQKMEAIGTLAGGIAHDFNNILAPIIGYTELSLNEVSKDPKLSNHMRQVLLAAYRAKDLVKQILTFSRKTQQERKPVQVSLILKEALKLLRSSLPSTVIIRQLLQPDAVESTTMADPTQIHQVLMNLCTNAAHAMREHGGTLSVSLENIEIDARAETGPFDVEPGSYLRLSVADTGHGMDRTVKQRIFDPYFTTKGPNEGTGLGLAVVYGIVKDLSGAITVLSEPGEGATFYVYLPRIKTISRPHADQSEPLVTGNGLVLVVDDEKFIVEMVKAMLETLGYEVVSRCSGPDALEAFKVRPDNFDLIITDMTMPHMTGTDLAREIFKIRADVPIILCTGFSETVDEDRAKMLGIQAFIMKPINMRDLSVTVSRILVEGKSKK
jgi:PAS domain S-box-containing protein